MSQKPLFFEVRVANAVNGNIETARLPPFQTSVWFGSKLGGIVSDFEKSELNSAIVSVVLRKRRGQS